MSSEKVAETEKIEKPFLLFVVLIRILMIAIFIMLAILYVPLIPKLVNSSFFLRETFLVEKLTPNQSFQALGYYRRWLKDYSEYKGRIYKVAIMQTALARYYFDRNEFNKAQKILQKVVNNNSTFPSAYNLLGIIYSKQGNKILALEAYKKGINIAPPFAKIELTSLYENLGLDYYSIKKFDLAVEAFESAKALDPDQPDIYINLCAGLLELNGRAKDAESACRKALELGSRDALAHNNLGYSLALQGNIPEAIVEFKKALVIDPTLKIAQENLDAYQNKRSF